MTVLSAQTIQHLCLTHGMVTPFYGKTVIRGMSYGLSSAGYDVRFVPGLGNVVRIDTGGFMLGATMEHFRMPKDVIGFVHDKSSWAREGLAVQNTVIEPGWRGHLTLELTNHGQNELFIQAGDPIAQIVFHRLDAPTEQPYDGKYQDQAWGPQKAIEETG